MASIRRVCAGGKSSAAACRLTGPGNSVGLPTLDAYRRLQLHLRPPGGRKRSDGRGNLVRMYFLFLFGSGIIIGLIVAAPIGPVNLICIRRTLAYGALNGFVSGLGAAL